MASSYISYIQAICEEFTDTVLIDKKNHSLLVNVAKEWFTVLNDKLTSIGFKLTFKQSICNNYTCAYIFAKAKVDS